MTDGKVVLVDFAGTRSASSFTSWPADLLARCELLTGVDVRLPSSTPAYVESLADRVAPARQRHIMAFCLSTGIAQQLARCLVDRGHEPPPLTAFDPTVCEPDDLLAAYHDVAVQILPGESVPLLSIDTGRVAAEPRTVLAEIEADLTARTCLSLHRPYTADDGLVNSLVERCMRWLRYLGLAIDCTWPEWGGEATRIMSAGYDAGLAWPGAIRVASRRIDIPQDALLASDAVLALARQVVLTCPS